MSHTMNVMSLKWKPQKETGILLRTHITSHEITNKKFIGGNVDSFNDVFYLIFIFSLKHVSRFVMWSCRDLFRALTNFYYGAF